MCTINSMAKKAAAAAASGKVLVIMRIIQLGTRKYIAPIKWANEFLEILIDAVYI